MADPSVADDAWARFLDKIGGKGGFMLIKGATDEQISGMLRDFGFNFLDQALIQTKFQEELELNKPMMIQKRPRKSSTGNTGKGAKVNDIVKTISTTKPTRPKRNMHSARSADKVKSTYIIKTAAGPPGRGQFIAKPPKARIRKENPISARAVPEKSKLAPLSSSRTKSKPSLADSRRVQQRSEEEMRKLEARKQKAKAEKHAARARKAKAAQEAAAADRSERSKRRATADRSRPWVQQPPTLEERERAAARKAAAAKKSVRPKLSYNPFAPMTFDAPTSPTKAKSEYLPSHIAELPQSHPSRVLYETYTDSKDEHIKEEKSVAKEASSLFEGFLSRIDNQDEDDDDEDYERDLAVKMYEQERMLSKMRRREEAMAKLKWQSTDDDDEIALEAASQFKTTDKLDHSAIDYGYSDSDDVVDDKWDEESGDDDIVEPIFAPNALAEEDLSTQVPALNDANVAKEEPEVDGNVQDVVEQVNGEPVAAAAPQTDSDFAVPTEPVNDTEHIPAAVEQVVTAEEENISVIESEMPEADELPRDEKPVVEEDAPTH